MQMSKAVLLLCALEACSVLAGDYEAVVDDSVVGYWRFNDPDDYGKDSSGHGSHITEWTQGAKGEVVTVATDASGSRGGGCLELPCSNPGKPTVDNCGSAEATVTSGKGFSMSRTSPGWTVATWVRGSAELVKSIEGMTSVGEDTEAGKFKAALEDGKWHPLVVVYRPDAEDKNYYHVYVDAFDSKQVVDITAGGTDERGKPVWYIPLDISTDTVNLGGSIGGSYKVLFWENKIKGTFFGGMDDCIILDRELEGGWKTKSGESTVTDGEVFRFVQTGETFVFSRGGGDNMFKDAGKWSNGLAPKSDLAYMIENGHEVKLSETAEFVGKSLSIGRTEKLYGIKSVDATAREVIVDNTIGKLTQVTANTTMTVDNLVLNAGRLRSSASGQSLVANMLVRAPASNPFEIFVASGTYTVRGTLRGTGSVSKIGTSTLDLSRLTESTAKVSLAQGALRLPDVNPTLSGYVEGTLIVGYDQAAGTAKTVTIDASWTGVLSFRLNGTPTKFARYAAIRVPTSVKTVSAADFNNVTSIAPEMAVRTKVVSDGIVQTVYVECVPMADQAGSPILVFE